MTTTTDDRGSRALLVGDGGAERAIAWSVVGFLVVWYGVPAVAASTTAGPSWFGFTTLAWIGVAIILCSGFCAAALAARYRGVLPAIVLVFGPVAAYVPYALEPSLLPVAHVEALFVALAVAIGTGVGGYVVGRTAALVVRNRES